MGDTIKNIGIIGVGDAIGKGCAFPQESINFY